MFLASSSPCTVLGRKTDLAMVTPILLISVYTRVFKEKNVVATSTLLTINPFSYILLMLAPSGNADWKE